MQFLLILAVVAALVISENSPPAALADGPWRLAGALGAMALVGLAAAVGAARIVRRLGRGLGKSEAARQFRSLRGAISALWIVSMALVYYALGWGQLVRFNWRLDHVLLVDDLLVLTPVVLPLVLAWAAFYGVDRAVRLPEADSARLPGRWKYVWMHLRFFLGILLVPVLGLLAIQDLLAWFHPQLLASQSPYAALALAPPVALLVLFFPCLLRFVWDTRPLMPGPLRQRLEEAARRGGFRLREILVWQTDGMVVNAAVAGFLPPLRYVFLSDGLLAQLSDEQIEAVFGHEVGHVRHRHLALRVLAMASPVSLWLLAQQLWPDALHALAEAAGGWGLSTPVHLALATVGLMGAYTLFVFGAYSRMLEGQADLFGCRALAGAAPLPGVETFVSALEKLAAVSGVDRNAPSWQHASVAQRVAFLERIAEDPGYERSFTRRLRLVALALGAAAFSPVAYRLLAG